MSDKIVKKVENLPQLTAVKRTDKLIQRVAAYARVSTGKEEQQTSIVAQKEYYTDYIKSHAGWQFVGVYADEGISGCSTKRREQFKQLMSDCMAGKIDMVLTKSISRFGRNTVDTLTTIRELKSKGIGVYFEKEQVWTMDSKGEFIITLMSSLAQEESRSMSENILWAVRKRYAQGKGSFAYSRVLGLDKGKEKFEIVVNREEAVIVCKIFRMFIQGLTPHTIAIALTAAGIPSPGGCEVWSAATVRRMLSNEKYKGDMLLQKEFTVDFLTKKVKKNEGELPQYYVSNNHEPIIDPWLFDFVQENFKNRKRENKRRYSGIGFFSSKIICAKCGATFGPRPWHSTSYNNSVWQCRNRYSAVKCKTTNIYDKLLFYVLHDVARKKIVAKDIRTAIVEFAADAVSADRLAAIERYIENFESMSAWKMLSDADDLSFVIDRVLVKPDSGHFADVLAAASSNANTNVSMLGESFKYCAPIAGALGFSCEDTAEALGLMANAGIKSTQSGTSMRSIMTALSGNVKFCSAAFGEMEIATSNSDGSMRSLSDILADCRVAFDQMSESEKASTAQSLVGKNAMSGFLALMNAAPADIDKLSGAIANCDGTSLSMAETMQDNLAGQLTILKSQLEELAISFGEILMPVIRDIITKIQGFVDKLNALDPATKQTILKIGLMAAALGPLLIVVGKTISSIGSMMTFISKIPTMIAGAKTAFSTLGAAIGSISAPVVAVVAVIAVLIAAFVNLWNTNEDFKNSILSIWEQIKSTFERLTSGIVDRINALGFDFQNFGELLKAMWNGLCSVLAPVFEGVFQHISNIFTFVTDSILSVLDVFIGLLSGNWEQCWNGIKDIFTAIWDFVVNKFSNILNVLRGVADVFLGWFGTSWNEVWTSIKDFFVGIWDSICSAFQSVADFFTNIWNAISTFFITMATAIYTTAVTIFTSVYDFFAGILTSIHDFFSTIFNAIWTVISTVCTAIYDTISSIWNAIYSFISPLLEAFQYLFETIFQAIHIIISNVMDWISEKIQTIWNAVVAFLTPLLEGIKTFFETIWNAIYTTISTALSTISSVISTVWTAISGFISGVMNTIHSIISSVWNAISSAVSSVVNAIRNTVSSVWNSISSTISSVMNTIHSTVTNIWNNVKSSVASVISGIYSTIKGGFDNAVNYVKGLASDAWNWGRDIVSNIIDGLRSMIGSLADSVSNIADTIRSYLHFSVPDVGPLTDFESWMPDFMNGLADGINKSKKVVAKAVSGVADTMKLSLNSEQNYNLDGMTGAMMNGTSENSVVNNYYQNDNSRTVNQTNNSPKSLSRLEIYRLTKNAVKQ